MEPGGVGCSLIWRVKYSTAAGARSPAASLCEAGELRFQSWPGFRRVDFPVFLGSGLTRVGGRQKDFNELVLGLVAERGGGLRALKQYQSQVVHNIWKRRVLIVSV